MNNNLKSLLSQYDQKHSRAIYNSIQKKENFYNEHPDIEKLDHDISALGMRRIQLILRANNRDEIKKISKMINDENT